MAVIVNGVPVDPGDIGDALEQCREFELCRREIAGEPPSLSADEESLLHRRAEDRAIDTLLLRDFLEKRGEGVDAGTLQNDQRSASERFPEWEREKVNRFARRKALYSGMEKWAERQLPPVTEEALAAFYDRLLVKPDPSEKRRLFFSSLFVAGFEDEKELMEQVLTERESFLVGASSWYEVASAGSLFSDTFYGYLHFLDLETLDDRRLFRCLAPLKPGEISEPFVESWDYVRLYRRHDYADSEALEILPPIKSTFDLLRPHLVRVLCGNRVRDILDELRDSASISRE